ncbi:MAG: tetratricopeptide repeat protein [Betaproteobacteria bacterium]
MSLIHQKIAAIGCSFFACLWLIGPTFAQSESPAETSSPKEIKDTGLTDQILYQYLISEIAAQRGRAGLALKGMIDLAQRTRDPRVARRAAEIAFQARQMDDALEATTLWLEFEPDSSVARQALTAISGNLGTLESAKANFARLLAKPSRAAGVLMQLSSLLSRFPDKAATLATVRELATPYFNTREAQFAIAQASMFAKDASAALAAISEADSLDAGWSKAAILKSQILRESSEESARTYLRDYLKSHPTATDVRIVFARLLTAQKEYLAAREEFRLAMKSKPDEIETLYAIALLSQQLDDYADAEAQLKRVLELKPGDANPVYFNLGTIADAQKRPADAIAWYRQVKGGDYFVGAQLKTADIIAKRDGMSAGRKYLQEAQANQTDAPETRIQLILAEAQLLRDAKAFKDAFDALSEAIRNNPDTSDLLYDRAMVAEKIGKFDVLETDLRKVIVLRPDHPAAYNALGYTFADRNKRLDEANTLVRKALELSPDDAFIQDSLGWVQFRSGQLDDALVTLKKAYQTRRDPEIAAHLGEVLWVKGERDEASKLWQTALLEFPGNELLRTVIAKFKP